MAQVILDVGSGASLPDKETARRFVDEIKAVDTGKHQIVFKAQLFMHEPPNAPLSRFVFADLYDYAIDQGYGCTASVFDQDSLNYLSEFDVPFIKIACRPDLYEMINDISGEHMVYASYYPTNEQIVGSEGQPLAADRILLCVPHYPAQAAVYKMELMHPEIRFDGLSDHTVGLDLYRELEPKIWEKHIKLAGTVGPDAGPWAMLPEEVGVIL